MSVGQFNTIDPNNSQPQNLVNTDYRTYNFDVIDGVTYEFDITQPNKYDRVCQRDDVNLRRISGADRSAYGTQVNEAYDYYCEYVEHACRRT